MAQIMRMSIYQWHITLHLVSNAHGSPQLPCFSTNKASDCICVFIDLCAFMSIETKMELEPMHSFVIHASSSVFFAPTQLLDSFEIIITSRLGALVKSMSTKKTKAVITSLSIA